MENAVILGDLTNTNLWATNPYANGTVFIFPEKDGQLTRKPLIYIKSSKDKTRTILEGEDLSSIAYEEYGDSKWYWVLAEVNNYLLALDINVGDIIIIPDLDLLFVNQPD